MARAAMAAAPDNGMLRPPGPPPLGAILVRRGLLSEEQLAAALAESNRSGEPTGEVIVRLGFASAATIAQALATQHGGPLKTEYGYAVGFGGAAPVGPVGPPPVSVPAQDERPTAPAPGSAVRATPPVEPAPVPAPPSPAPALPAPVPEPADPLPPAAVASAPTDPAVLQLQAQLQQLAAERDAAKSRTAGLELQVEQLQATSATQDAERDAELAKAREEAARVQMEKVALEAAHESMASHTADLEDRVKQLEAANARTAKLEKQLEEATAQVAHLEAEREDVLKVAKVLGEERRHHDHADDPAHLLFVPGREGYRLVEQEGPPPAPGSTLDVEDEEGTPVTLTVTKVGASPLPGTRLACAYLVAAA